MVAIGMIAAVALLLTLPRFDAHDLLGSLERLRLSPPGRLLFAPLEVFPRIATSRTYFELAGWASLAAAMVVGLFALSISQDVNYLEAAQQVSERGLCPLAAPQASRRRRRMADLPTAKMLRIPRLPWLFGVGPNLWRRWLFIVRRSRALVVVALLILVGGSVIIGARRPAASISCCPRSWSARSSTNRCWPRCSFRSGFAAIWTGWSG